MAEIVNLNRARKAKAKAEKIEKAAANRALHGTPKSLRKLSDAQKTQAQQRLNGHELDSGGED